jgi:RNA polymerase sigma-70 factor (ECF subfamily)
MTNRAHIQLAKAGHRDAFRVLYDDHRERIYRLAFRYTRSAEEAKDVMQETFIRAFRSLDSAEFDTEGSFPSWLSRICVHCAIDHLRATRRRAGNGVVPLSELPIEPASTAPAPDRVVMAIRTVAWVREATRRLSPGQQEIFDLRYTAHLEIKEIARHMDCSESTVKTQLGRAVEKLREALQPVWGEP